MNLYHHQLVLLLILYALSDVLTYKYHQHMQLKMNFFNDMFKQASSASSSKSKQQLKTVLISGASGLVGTALTKSLVDQGLNVYKITTNKKSTASDINSIYWNPDSNEFDDVNGLLGNKIYGVVHLAGENVASGEGPLAVLGRWTDSKKNKILNSRTQSTSLLVNKLKTIKPSVFVSASAVGYYGYTDSTTIFNEQASRGEGFLADVCDQWESAALKASSIPGIRTTILRFSVILSKQGGIIKKLFPIFNLGIGGPLGDGSQGFSFVTLDDAVRSIEFALFNNNVKGIYNVCGEACDNNEFTKSLGDSISRPAIFPVPEIVGNLVFGEMGKEMLFNGQKASSSKLEKAGFKYNSSNIKDALIDVMNSK